MDQQTAEQFLVATNYGAGSLKGVEITTYSVERGKFYQVCRYDNGAPDRLFVDGLPTSRPLAAHRAIAEHFRFSLKIERWA